MLVSQSVLVCPSTPKSMIDWIFDNTESFIDVHGVAAFSNESFSAKQLNLMGFERMLIICGIYNKAYEHILNTGDYDLYEPESLFCKKLIFCLASSDKLSSLNCVPIVNFLSSIVFNTPGMVQTAHSSWAPEYDGTVEPCYIDSWKTLFSRGLVPGDKLKELLAHLFATMSHDFVLLNNLSTTFEPTPSSKIAEFILTASSVNVDYQGAIRPYLETLRCNYPEHFHCIDNLIFEHNKNPFDESSDRTGARYDRTLDVRTPLDEMLEYCKNGSLFNARQEGEQVMPSSIPGLVEKLTLSDSSILSKENAIILFEFVAEANDYDLLPLIPWVMSSDVCSISCIEDNINTIYTKYPLNGMTFNASTRAIEAIDILLAKEERWSNGFLISCMDDFDHWLRQSLPAMIDRADKPSYEVLSHLFNRAFDKWTSFTSENIQELQADNLDKSIAIAALKKMCTQYIYPSLFSGAETYDDVIPQVLIKGIKLEELSELDISIISQTRKLKLYTSLGGDDLNNVVHIQPGVQEALTAALLTEITMEKCLDEQSSLKTTGSVRYQM